MSSGSDNEEFYDAEDKPATKQTVGLNNQQKYLRQKITDEKMPAQTDSWDEQLSSPHPTLEEIVEAERKAQDLQRRSKKVEERRRKMLTDDDDLEILSELSSKASSTDGTFLGRSSSQSFDSRSEGHASIVSLGKVGSLLGDDDNLSSDPKPEVVLAEPDLVASTKCDHRVSEVQAPPKAPPRHKRRTNHQAVRTMSDGRPQSSQSLQGLPSPCSALEHLTQELEHSLDLRSAIRGDHVVKPQDNERDRAPYAENETKESSPKMELAPGARRGSSENQQPNIMMRTRSDSGRPLTDLEILEQVMVLNLDTMEQVPLSLAEDRLPRGINPLSLHIMRLTSEYVSNSNLDKMSDDDGDGNKKMDSADAGTKSKKGIRFKKMLETVERTVNKIKTVADEVYHSRHSEDPGEPSDDESSPDSKFSLKVKGSNSHKGVPNDFDGVKVVQELTGEHSGAIWTMKFSSCGRLLASAGQDHVLRIWILKNAFNYFNDMRQKYNAEAKVSPTPSQESLASGQLSNDDLHKILTEVEESEDNKGPFMAKPFCTYEGHTADLLDVSWSKNYFILSSSMDKTVRLWHISRKECLCCFQHMDFVTAIAFHPRDDRYFLSGSLDGKLRMWNIPDKKVALWNELDGQTKLITAANFCQNGKFAVIGSYDGRCIFYNTEQLKYYTQLNVRSTRGKNKQGRKISGIEPMPGEDKILVTSNDSRIRLYDLRDLSLTCKYKGYVNLSSQIRASFSHDGKYIVSGSENQFIYLWRRQHKFNSGRRDRNDYWEGIKAHNAVVTAAVFAPNPNLVLQQLDQSEHQLATTPSSEATPGYVFVSADFSGAIKVFAKKPKGKASTLPVGLPSS